MQLYEELLTRQIGALALEALQVCSADFETIAELGAVKALEKIKAIVHDDSLSDFDCVEQIVRVFEELGSSGGARHDF